MAGIGHMHDHVYSSLVKRALDVVAVLVAAPVAAVVAGAMALALAIDFGGNPFFVQERVGLHGRPFRMYKLRTMRHARRGEHKPYVIEDWKTFVFSPPNVRDPRLTKLGEFARKTSIDELPNLLNILFGQMSLVGPRPEIPEIVAQYPPEYQRRHSVRPGLTGLAQVRGRSDLPYDAIMHYDLNYVDHQSFAFDLRILLWTARDVLTGSGAR
jgi:lipopolysaccharide/colanic/teichoic acid biosynthesis glycosyltransferase